MGDVLVDVASKNVFWNLCPQQEISPNIVTPHILPFWYWYKYAVQMYCMESNKICAPIFEFSIMGEPSSTNPFPTHNVMIELLFSSECQDATMNATEEVFTSLESQFPHDSETAFLYTLAKSYAEVWAKNLKNGLFWPFFWFFGRISSNNVANVYKKILTYTLHHLHLVHILYDNVWTREYFLKNTWKWIPESCTLVTHVENVPRPLYEKFSSQKNDFFSQPPLHP